MDKDGKSMPAAAMVNLRPPPPFDFGNPGEWRHWLLQFEDYSFTSGLHVAAAEVRVSTVLYCMGPRAWEILSSLHVPDDQLKDFNAVTGKFESYFVHPTNELYESARFHRRTQQPGESAEAFYTALWGMVR